MIPYHDLVDKAIEARNAAYAPYSGFKVGAALLTKDGRIFTGCNIENAAYSPTNCAERTAFFKAVSEGALGFAAIAVTGFRDGSQVKYTYPCGVCLQVMMEFCDPSEMTVIAAKSSGDYRISTLAELLPKGFGPANL